MSELREILNLWQEARGAGEEFCLATVIGTEGSSYRKAGARMLFTQGGRRAGTVSGGCLEAEIQKKGWWHTEHGGSLQRYSSFLDEDSDAEYGAGCGGVVHVLLERGPSAHAVLSALELGANNRLPVVSVVRIAPGRASTVLVRCGDETLFEDSDHYDEAAAIAKETARTCRSVWSSGTGRFFAEYIASPLTLLVVGAGDDVKPIVEFAYRLGWKTTVADGRSHLVTRQRFPLADTLLPSIDFDASFISEHDAAVILTHSYEQDRTALRSLLGSSCPYLGLLGARQRSERLLLQIAPSFGMTLEDCLNRIHAPVGFKIGATNPATIALAICAEIQAVFHEHDHLQRSLRTHACA